MNKYVAILSGGSVTIHLPDITGNYATLCGLDGDDLDPSVDQQVVETRGRIDCITCFNIWSLAQKYTKKDFTPHI